MTKRQIKAELKANMKTGLTLEQSANSLVFQFEMYANLIRECEMEIMVKKILDGAVI